MPPRALSLEGAEVLYFPALLSPDDAHRLFRELDGHRSWQKRPIWLRDRQTGKHFEALEGRPTISFSIPPGREYRYSGSWRVAEEFPEGVLAAKARVEALLGPRLADWARAAGRHAAFNYCLANKYEHGAQSVGKHADDEPDIVPRSPIATLSLGAARAFCVEAKGDPERKSELTLHAGSVLLMTGRTQERFLHSIPKDKRVREPRISLTFRMNV